MLINVHNIETIPVSLSDSIIIPDSYNIRNNSVPFTLKGTVSRTKDRNNELYVLNGTVRAVLDFNCELCLEPASETISFDIDEMFCNTIYAQNNSGNQSAVLQSKATDDSFYNTEKEIWNFSDDTIDVEPMLTSGIILNLPMRFICSDACKGLCPICGINLNTSDCRCANNAFDSRFEKLRFLFIDKEV